MRFLLMNGRGGGGWRIGQWDEDERFEEFKAVSMYSLLSMISKSFNLLCKLDKAKKIDEPCASP